MKTSELKKQTHLTDLDIERLELLQKANQKQGKQLRISTTNGDLSEINEIREMIGYDFENPDKKYDIYYRGMRTLLIKYLPKGKEYKEGRQLIYDEKNIFLNRGKRKSDNYGNTRKSDGRMTYQEKMNEMLDVIVKWVSESLNPTDLFYALYDLNEKHGYGHENYDSTSVKFQKAAANRCPTKTKGQ